MAHWQYMASVSQIHKTYFRKIRKTFHAQYIVVKLRTINTLGAQISKALLDRRVSWGGITLFLEQILKTPNPVLARELTFRKLVSLETIYISNLGLPCKLYLPAKNYVFSNFRVWHVPLQLSKLDRIAPLIKDPPLVHYGNMHIRLVYQDSPHELDPHKREEKKILKIYKN